VPVGPDLTRAAARGARAEEWPACRKLVSDIGYSPELFETLTVTDPEHAPGCVRVLDIGGRLVSLAVVVPRRVRVAGIPVEGVILTLAGTHPDYRGAGLTDVLLEDTMVFIRSHGIRVALVEGSPALYRRHDFVPCFPSYRVDFPAEAGAVTGAEEAGPGAGAAAGGSAGETGSWRPMRREDAPALSKLFERSLGPGLNPDRVAAACAVLRPPEPWVWTSPAGPDIYVLERGRKVAAYARVFGRAGPDSLSGGGPEGALVVTEAAGLSMALVAEVLRWVSRRAVASGAGRVAFTGPPDHPLTRLALLRCGAEVAVRATHRRHLAVTNRGLLVADIAPGLARRAARAELVRLLGGRVDREVEVPVSRLSPEAFTRLMTGTAGAADMIDLPGVTVAEEHLEALAALFPVSYPVWIPAPFWPAGGWRPDETLF